MVIKSQASSLEEAIRSRLQLVVEDYNQAVLARKTQVPQSSISRYLVGRRIPADFCAAVVLQLGVDPGWLLTGEGSRYTVDVDAEVSERATQLVRLLEALNASSRMSLASLTASSERRELRTLNDRLQTQEELQARLEREARPTCDRLMAALEEAKKQNDTHDMKQCLSALQAVGRLVRDDELQARIDDRLACFEMEWGSPEEALQLRMRSFRRSLVTTRESLDQQFGRDNMLLWSLFDFWQLQEARRIAKALILDRDDCWNMPHYQALRHRLGALEFELGDLRGGLDLMVSAGMALPAYRNSSKRLHAQLLAGTVSAESIPELLQDLDEKSPRDQLMVCRQLVDHCVSLELWEPLRDLRDRIRSLLSVREDESSAAPAPRSRPGSILLLHISYMLRAVDKRERGLLAKYLDEPAVRALRTSALAKDRVVAGICTTQLARYVSRDRTAEFLLESEVALQDLAHDVTPWLFFRIMHHRSALAVSPNGEPQTERIRGRAQAFFEQYVGAGYEALRPLFREVTSI